MDAGCRTGAQLQFGSVSCHTTSLEPSNVAFPMVFLAKITQKSFSSFPMLGTDTSPDRQNRELLDFDESKNPKNIAIFGFLKK